MPVSTLTKSIAAAAAAIALLAGATSCTHTPQFKDAAGTVIDTSIAEERMVTLGGNDQYVLIRGRDTSAPILLFLHGGPGTSAMPFNRLHNADLEDDFLFVNWDQRGTGKSFTPDLDPATLTVDRMTKDLDELVDLLRAEFSDQKILLVGYSWGSLLGLNYVSQHPEKVAGYVGIGQMANTAASETEMYQWAVSEATRRGDTAALDTLEEIGAPPYANVDEMMTERAIVGRYGGSWVQPKSDIAYAREVIRAPEFAWTELRAILRGGAMSLDALYDAFTAFDAAEAHPVLDVPVFIIMGRGDRVVSTAQAEKYVDVLEAPRKELIWFEASAHSPQWEEAERFNAELRRISGALDFSGE